MSNASFYIYIYRIGTIYTSLMFYMFLCKKILKTIYKHNIYKYMPIINKHSIIEFAYLCHCFDAYLHLPIKI